MRGTLLSAHGVRAGYGRVEIIHGVDLTVREGEKVALLGPNGAGKTTLLRALSRIVATTGEVLLDGVNLRGKDAAAVCRLGVGHVPAGRGTFADLTVTENLRLGLLARPRSGVLARGRPGEARDRATDLETVLGAFPVLAERRRQSAGSLSGGEQQMLALARALLGRPRLLLIDEPSQGLAPSATHDLLGALDVLRRRWGMALLLAEQNVRLSLGASDRAYVLVGGRIVLHGPGSSLTPTMVREAYLGRAAPADSPSRSGQGPAVPRRKTGADGTQVAGR